MSPVTDKMNSLQFTSSAVLLVVLLQAALAWDQIATGCVHDSDCHMDEACRRRKCSDPCLGACGTDASCKVINHKPVCSCGQDFEGDPSVLCEQTKLCLGKNRVYSFHRLIMKSQPNASLYCLQKDMRLVSITNAEKQLEIERCLSNYLPAGRDVWVWTAGVYTSSSKVNWPVSSPGNYSNFQKRHGLTRTSCVDLMQAQEYKWGTYDCNVKQAFLCEKILDK